MSRITDVIGRIIQGSDVGSLLFLAFIDELAKLLVAKFGINVIFLLTDNVKLRMLMCVCSARGCQCQCRIDGLKTGKYECRPIHALKCKNSINLTLLDVKINDVRFGGSILVDFL